jgi:hypothetical protein
VVEDIEVEMHRDLHRLRRAQPVENAFGRTRQVLRAEAGDPVFPDEIGHERRCLGQTDIEDALWIDVPAYRRHEIGVTLP